MGAGTLRFAKLVEAAGQPHVLTLWTEPGKDSELQKAVRENRVLTVEQPPTGTKKDLGKIGFHRDANVSYLIFPKRLPKQSETKVVGIKYDRRIQNPKPGQRLLSRTR
jgi:hypothetical protein